MKLKLIYIIIVLIATSIYNLKGKKFSEYNNDTNGTFTLNKKHNLKYEEHNYNKFDIIKKI